MDDHTKGVLFLLGAWVAYGSFAVPIKSPAVVAANVDPLVYQVYKTAAVLLSSFFVLLLHPWVFTPWGFVGALIWVPSGVTAVAAVRLAGLAVSQGLWSAVSVVVSFLWGAVVFGEEVHNWPLAVLAVLLTIAGTVGMARASTPSLPPPSQMRAIGEPSPNGGGGGGGGGGDDDDAGSGAESDESTALLETGGAGASDASAGLEGSGEAAARGGGGTVAAADLPAGSSLASVTPRARASRLRAPPTPDETTPLSPPPGAAAGGAAAAAASMLSDLGAVPPAARRRVGLAFSVFTGAFGGSMYVPLHYAGKAAHGIQYTVSFGIGSACVAALMLLAYSAHRARPGCGLRPPSFHWRVALVPGLTCGLLWAIGNACGIYATVYLGQAVGATSIQANLLVAGLWSSFYYGEMRGARFAAWTASALVCFGGIALLVAFG